MLCSNTSIPTEVETVDRDTQCIRFNSQCKATPKKKLVNGFHFSKNAVAGKQWCKGLIFLEYFFVDGVERATIFLFTWPPTKKFK